MSTESGGIEVGDIKSVARWESVDSMTTGNCMNWRIVGASTIGTSHRATDTPCQDSNWAMPGRSADGRTVLCAFAADGAGTAPQGGAGAEAAMEATAAFLVTRIGCIPEDGGEALLIECASHVANRIREVAIAAGLTPRDFACTWLGVLATETVATVVQIGDGGVVIDVGRGLEMPVTPMNGEYANQTYFITDDDALERVQTASVPGRAERVAVFTDGIQRIAVDLATNLPHEPFFRGFFDVLSKAIVSDEDRLHDALLAFLGGPAVEQRTDDDKTLVLAARGVPDMICCQTGDERWSCAS